jgi:hypothetical protein
LPFYTDEPAITDKGEFDFEFSNQYDILQLQYPSLRQNTISYKLPKNPRLALSRFPQG